MTPALLAQPGSGWKGDFDSETFIVEPTPYDLFQITAPVNRQNRKPGDPCHTLPRDNAASAAIVVPIAFGCKDSEPSASENIAPTLRSMAEDKGHANGGGQVAVAFQTRIARNGHGVPNEIVPALSAQAGRTGKGDTAPCVAFKASHYTRNKDGAPAEIAPPLSADADKGDQDTLIAGHGWTVRRLTPVECERLQGFPDNFTNIVRANGKPAADGPRYRALGNSMAVPVMRWILTRLEAERQRAAS